MYCYQRPNAHCRPMLTPAMAIQHTSPSKIGFPPVLTSFTKLVFNPMALIAITIKNLLSCLRDRNAVLAYSNTADPVNKDAIRVVTTDAKTKYKINMGKMLFN